MARLLRLFHKDMLAVCTEHLCKLPLAFLVEIH